jgi:NADH:ubiquinone oxidoreductase subunit F (NADH-binding)
MRHKTQCAECFHVKQFINYFSCAEATKCRVTLRRTIEIIEPITNKYIVVLQGGKFD